MSYPQNELQKMSKADLASILMNDYGKVPADNARKDDLIEQILSLQGSVAEGPDDLLDNDVDGDGDAASDEPRPAKAIDPEGRTWIKVHNDEHDIGDVFLCHDGDSCQIKREHWVHVKNKFILGPLNDSVMTLYRDNGIGHPKRRFNITIWNGPGVPVDSDHPDQMVTPLMIN